MSKINQALDNQRDERAEESNELIAEQEARDNFVKDEQKESQELDAFRQGKSRRNLYEELSQEGIEDDRYEVVLTKVATAKTAGGKPIVRFTYKLVETYEFKGEELANVHINTTSSDEWSEEYNTNFAMQTLGTLYEILGAKEDFEEPTTQAIVNSLQAQIEDGLNEKTFEVNTRAQRIRNADRQLVFYTVYPV